MQFPMHPQVPFYTLGNGAVVKVDAGLVDILNRMRSLGLKTQYSCQGGGGHEAYVLMDRASGKRFEKMLKTAKLSGGSRHVANKFLNGPRMHDVSLALRDYEFFRWMITINPAFKIRPKPNRRYFKVERSYQLAPHWLRTTYRWSPKMSGPVLRLLDELLEARVD